MFPMAASVLAISLGGHLLLSELGLQPDQLLSKWEFDEKFKALENKKRKEALELLTKQKMEAKQPKPVNPKDLKINSRPVVRHVVNKNLKPKNAPLTGVEENNKQIKIAQENFESNLKKINELPKLDPLPVLKSSNPQISSEQSSLPIKVVNKELELAKFVGDVAQKSVILGGLTIGAGIQSTKLATNLISDTKDLLNIEKSQFQKKMSAAYDYDQKSQPSKPKHRTAGQLKEVAGKFVKNLPSNKAKALHKLATDFSDDEIKTILSYASKDSDLNEATRQKLGSEEFASTIIKDFKIDRSSKDYLKKWSNISKPNFGDIHLDSITNSSAPTPSATPTPVLSRIFGNESPSMAAASDREIKESELMRHIKDTSDYKYNNNIRGALDKAAQLNEALNNPNPNEYNAYVDKLNKQMEANSQSSIKLDQMLPESLKLPDTPVFSSKSPEDVYTGIKDTISGFFQGGNSKPAEINAQEAPNIEAGVVFPGHVELPNTPKPGSSFETTPVNFGIEPEQPVSSILKEVGQSTVLNAGQLAGHVLASQMFGPYGAHVFSSVYQNLLTDLVEQNQNYGRVAGQISRSISAQALGGFGALKKTGIFDKQTSYNEKKDFIEGRSNPTKRKAEDGGDQGDVLPKVKARNEFNNLGLEDRQLNLLGGDIISGTVTDAFIQRSSSDSVNQSQQDFQSWFKSTAPFATR